MSDLKPFMVVVDKEKFYYYKLQDAKLSLLKMACRGENAKLYELINGNYKEKRDDQRTGKKNKK